MSGLRLLLNSYLAEKYEFHTCFQTRAAGGLNIRLATEMARCIRSLRPDILHVRGLQNEGFHGLIAGKLAGCRNIVVSVHGFGGDNMDISPIKKFLFDWVIEPITLWNAKAVYCVSRQQAEHPMIKRWGRAYIGVIPNAAPVFRPTVPREIMRKRLGFSPGDVVCITVSRITKDKGFGVLARSIRMTNSKGCDSIRYLIVGDGDYANTFQQEVGKEIRAGRVIMAGSRSDVLDLLNAAEIFVFPTLHENLSNALLEAGAAGKAIIATDVGGNSEIITHRESGMLVPPSNPRSLQAVIAELATNVLLRRRLAAAIKRRVELAFSQDIVFAKLDELYECILAGGGRT